MTAIPNYHYCRKYILPKLFLALDTKRDGVLDAEEYISAICFFRFCPIEDQIRCMDFMLICFVGLDADLLAVLYLMYDSGKSSSNGINKYAVHVLVFALELIILIAVWFLLEREGLRQLIVDATIVAQRTEVALPSLEGYINVSRISLSLFSGQIR